MTYSKSVHNERYPNLDKGSTYGITSRWFGHYSFQIAQGSCGLGNSNRTKVLSGQAAIFPLQLASIMIGDEVEKSNISQRSEVRTNIQVPILLA